MHSETATPRYFAKAPGSYAGAVIEISRRMTGGVALVCVPLYALLLVASPPSEPAGWIVAGLAIAATLCIGLASGPQASWVSWDVLAAFHCIGLAEVIALIWLTGRTDSPFLSLIVLWTVLCAACHPPRRAVAFVLAAGLASVACLIDAGVGSLTAGQLGAQFFVAVFMAAVACSWVVSIRRERLLRIHNEEQAMSLARVDQLTGLANRRAFDEALIELTARMKLEGGALSVAVVDICRFKEINDRYGHLAGDGCLKEIAEAIRSTARADERVYRWGGDEFTVLLPGATTQDAERLCVRLRRAVAEACRDPAGAPIEIACGAGAITGEMDAGDLVRAADDALLAGRGYEQIRALGASTRLAEPTSASGGG